MIGEATRIALRALWSHKLRASLTISSVTIGAFSIVVMMSLAESGSATLSRTIEEVGGTRLVFWDPEPPRDTRLRSIYWKGFTLGDVEALKAVPHLKIATAWKPKRGQSVYRTADNILKADVVGVLEGVFEGLTWPFGKGRDFTTAEHQQYDRVCVITSEVAERLLGDENPLDQRISVLGKPYRIVGVLKSRKLMKGMNIGLGFDWERSVFIPLSTAEKREGLPIGSMFLTGFTDGQEHNETVIKLGNATLRKRHKGIEDFKHFNFADILEQFYSFFQILSLIVGAIAGISLIAGGIGVMNIMLVAVAERYREIGIRKTLGATRVAILSQFIAEASVLSFVGGLLGITLALGTTFLAHLALSQWTEFWVSIYSMTGIGLAVLVTGAIGLFFGAVPAYHASRLNIVECVRR